MNWLHSILDWLEGKQRAPAGAPAASNANTDVIKTGAALGIPRPVPLRSADIAKFIDIRSMVVSSVFDLATAPDYSKVGAAAQSSDVQSRIAKLLGVGSTGNFVRDILTGLTAPITYLVPAGQTLVNDGSNLTYYNTPGTPPTNSILVGDRSTIFGTPAPIAPTPGQFTYNNVVYNQTPGQSQAEAWQAANPYNPETGENAGIPNGVSIFW